jgi:hypothetical protein
VTKVVSEAKRNFFLNIHVLYSHKKYFEEYLKLTYTLATLFCVGYFMSLYHIFRIKTYQLEALSFKLRCHLPETERI